MVTWIIRRQLLQSKKVEIRRRENFFAITPVVSYYVGERVGEVVDTDVIMEDTDDQRFGLVEEFVLAQRFQNTYSSWIGDKCALKGRRDQ